MEATAVSVGKAVLNGALGYAQSKASEEIALQLGVERDVTFITDELQMMQSFLMTADEEQGQHKLLITWVQQVRDLAYKVEDSLMDFGLHVEKKPICGCIPRDLCDRRRIAMEVKDLRAKVEDISSRNLRYRLINEGLSSSKPAAVAGEQASLASATMFGINEARLAAVEEGKPKVDLHQLVTSGQENLGVMAVWGTDGDLGKTNEIRKVYDNKQVFDKFGCRAWVRLMHPFDPRDFLHSLVRQFYENSPEEIRKAQEGTTVGGNVLIKMENMGQGDLIRVFNARVTENRYLVVIDDLSTIVEWDCIKSFFPRNKRGSRIILSTRQAEIASLCPDQPLQVTELKQLSSDQALYLFHQEVTPASGVAETRPNTEKVITTEDNPVTSTSEIEEQLPESATGDTVNRSPPGKKFDRSVTTTVVEEVFTGREAEQDHVINLVGEPGNNQETKVISVWGMGGLGKTTLVRSTYRSQQLGGWKRAWISALRPFDPKMVIRSLALQLLSDVREDSIGATETRKEKKNIATMGLQELVEELNLLLNKNSLIVLDDISTTAEWDLVRSCLKNAGTVIVTTREKNVAKHCSGEDTNMYRLEGLKDAAALDVFKKKVFKDKRGEVNLDLDMEEQAKLILKKCDGLPLAISTIGGFLATRPKTAIEWRKMHGRISAELEINPDLRTIKTVLMRSYDGLPYHLKLCFLYMSIFPEDYIIKRKRLVRRWIAEGYCKEMHGMTAEEIGDNYFDELLDRSMILPREGVNHHSGKISSCQLHDIIREICISKAREENLVFTLEEGCCLSSTQGPIRHLVISSNWKRDKDVFDSMLDLSHVRSLTVYGEWRPYFISEKMRFLRVLDLEDTLRLINHHLDEIGQLRHLRYFSIRECVHIWYLPNSIGNLSHLQTLDIKGTRISELPTTVTKLHKLQHLRTTDIGVSTRKEDDMFTWAYAEMHVKYTTHSISQLEGNLRKMCSPRNLQLQRKMCLERANILRALLESFCSARRSELGLNMHDLFNVHRSLWMCSHKDTTGVKAPRGTGKWTSLQTLGVVNVTRGQEKVIKELNVLTQLRKLGVMCIDKRNGKKLWSAIAAHNQLRSLTVHGINIDDCLCGYLLPPKHLESLKLVGSLARVPDWMHHLQSLSKLDLDDSNLDKAVDIETLGGLPNLLVLRLRNKAIKMNELHFLGSSFPSLVVLEICFRSWKDDNLDLLRFEKDAMPKLELLQTDKYLEMNGLWFLTNLKEIRMHGRAMDKVKKQLENMYAEHPSLKNVSLKLM
ncbi:hypothetical protein ACQJBY_061817 [Aegilops geniculata]